jgi:inorganic pyrophosphatase
MDAIEFLNKEVEVVIDRPLSSKHPEHSFVYPINYGYLPDVMALDGEPLDAYILGEFEPLPRFFGHCIAIIRRLDDDDDKLIVVGKGRQYTDDQIAALTEFQE